MSTTTAPPSLVVSQMNEASRRRLLSLRVSVELRAQLCEEVWVRKGEGVMQ